MRTNSEENINSIQEKLGVVLPEGFKSFIINRRPPYLDEVSVYKKAKDIITATKEYRNGFSGNEPWPRKWVYIGDESDACPYVLDCSDGRVIRTDRGNSKRDPLYIWESFEAFSDNMKEDYLECQRIEKEAEEYRVSLSGIRLWWYDSKDSIRFYFLVFILIFVVVPIFGMTVKFLITSFLSLFK